MELHPADICIIVAYMIAVIIMGWLLSKRASKNLDAYFLGGKSLPWYVIGTSHGASGFDITGTMWFVTMLFTYGVKAAFIPWVWPLFDRVFRQVYLGPWIRRSNVLTGAEWMRTRFGTGLAGNLSHISVVVYALVATVGFLGYAFQGIGKFASIFFQLGLGLGAVFLCRYVRHYYFGYNDHLSSSRRLVQCGFDRPDSVCFADGRFSLHSGDRHGAGRPGCA